MSMRGCQYQNRNFSKVMLQCILLCERHEGVQPSVHNFAVPLACACRHSRMGSSLFGVLLTLLLELWHIDVTLLVHPHSHNLHPRHHC